jgi:hypothetical protein
VLQPVRLHLIRQTRQFLPSCRYNVILSRQHILQLLQLRRVY